LADLIAIGYTAPDRDRHRPLPHNFRETLVSTTAGGAATARDGDMSTTILPIQLIILHGCQMLFFF
jgi:hypothetical protein